ncbi:hypothetical protein D3C86_1502770 [compost metagenome]
MAVTIHLAIHWCCHVPDNIHTLGQQEVLSQVKRLMSIVLVVHQRNPVSSMAQRPTNGSGWPVGR